MRVAIIGGGAAGCFAAVNIKEMSPDIDVTVFESGKKPLAKVAVTGGGRCNLTNSFRDIRKLDEAYPRGARLMGRLFRGFDNMDTEKWFEDRGVPLVTQEDQCVFPKSQDAMSIVKTFLGRMRASGVRLVTEAKVTGLRPGWTLLVEGREISERYDAVIVAMGGSSAAKLTETLGGLDIEISKTVPSLFSLRIEDPDLRALMGTVVENVGVSMPKTKFRADGPLLITDWGMSGPAILRLSSYAALSLAEAEYRAVLMVNWFGDASVREITDGLSAIAASKPKRQVANAYPETFNARLWTYLVKRAKVNPESRWADLGTRNLNRLAERLHSDEYAIAGRNRFKSEFVTCGGVALSNLDPKTLECKDKPGLYFAGEVTDVDAITGGFNLQAAWTMGYTVARAIVAKSAGTASVEP